MTQTELPWLFRGRRIRPYALAVSFSTLVISWTLLVSRDGPGAALDRTVPGFFVGGFGMFAVVALWIGFWWRSDKWMQVGLILTSGVWCARGAFILLDSPGLNEAVGLSFCWVLASVGAFMLEHFTGASATRRRSRE